jgi:hypothetical protein
MAKLIRSIVEKTSTVYDDDGAIRHSHYSVRYQTEDVDDSDMSKWVDVETPGLDQTRTVTEQRDQSEAHAREAEGIATRDGDIPVAVAASESLDPDN